MKTLIFKIQVDNEIKSIIEEDSRKCSSIYRFSFNRYQDRLSTKDIYKLISDKFNDTNSHLRNSSLRQANNLFKRLKFKQHVKFGQVYRRKNGLIDEDKYKQSRNIGIVSEGESSYKGNRLFQIDLEHNCFIYKRNRKEHYKLPILEHLSDKRQHLLQTLSTLMVTKTIPVTFKLRNDNIYLSYDETIVENNKRFKNLFNNRILGIDLNPNYFGISILQFNYKDEYKVLFKQCIDITRLQGCTNKNKIKFELQQINHHILKLCKQFHVSKLSVEDLKFNPKNKFWNKDLNRLCKNKFRYSIVKTHLQTLCNTYGVQFIEINSSYSSIIGNFNHGSNKCPDMIASSIEIARRGYKKFTKGWFQPKFISKQRLQEVLGNQWKKELELTCNSWKELTREIKKSKLKYRFQLDPLNAVFSVFYIKKLYTLYTF